jgi:hypothetical protein
MGIPSFAHRLRDGNRLAEELGNFGATSEDLRL